MILKTTELKMLNRIEYWWQPSWRHWTEWEYTCRRLSNAQVTMQKDV